MSTRVDILILFMSRIQSMCILINDNMSTRVGILIFMSRRECLLLINIRMPTPVDILSLYILINDKMSTRVGISILFMSRIQSMCILINVKNVKMSTVVTIYEQNVLTGCHFTIVSRIHSTCICFLINVKMSSCVNIYGQNHSMLI